MEMAKFIYKYLDVNKKYKILDIGSLNLCGDAGGSYKILFLDSNWEYTGMDILAGPDVDIVGYENIKDKYDVIISGQTLEHVGRPWEFMKNLTKYANSGALVCIIAPHTCGFHAHPKDCFRYYPDGMESLFEYAGIEKLEIFMSEIPCDHPYGGTPIDTVAIGRCPTN
jgi:hypothetical protein